MRRNGECRVESDEVMAMNPEYDVRVIEALRRLLRILCRGMANYALDSHRWLAELDDPRCEALADLLADRERYAKLVAERLDAMGETLDPGAYPLEFGAANDLGLDYLYEVIVQSQREDVAAVAQCVDSLASQPELKDLAEEILGNMQGHAELLAKNVTGY